MTKHLKTCLSSAGKTSGNQNGNSANIGESVDVSKNLKNLSYKRPDIFGGEGQGIRKQQNKNDEEEKIVWDGQAPNMSRTTATIAMMQNQQRKMKEQMRDSK